MKNHYLLTQIADVLVQLYENGIKDIKIVKRTIEKIAERLLECLKATLLTEEDLHYKRIQIRRKIDSWIGNRIGGDAAR
jgi:shikimate 5-dehydrogenase